MCYAYSPQAGTFARMRFKVDKKGKAWKADK
jgi:hypothetical protein